MSDLEIVILTDTEAIIIIVGLILIGMIGLIELLIYNTDFLDGICSRLKALLKKKQPKHMVDSGKEIQTSGQEEKK